MQFNSINEICFTEYHQMEFNCTEWTSILPQLEFTCTEWNKLSFICTEKMNLERKNASYLSIQITHIH